MDKIVLILTCYNRREKTTECIRSILDTNKGLWFEIVLVDDQSTDGTREAVKEIAPNAHIIEGTGGLYWNGGMHLGMEYALETIPDGKYYVLLNDDVEFYPGMFLKMARELGAKTEVLVGATQADDGSLSYGGIVYRGRKSLKLRTVGPDEPGTCCDTFNANCVMLPAEVFKKAGATDPHYAHSMGDFDYGFTVKRLGYPIYVFSEFVGKCNDNPVTGTWQDKSLSAAKRFRLKEGPKGLPFKDWFRFLRKNFGTDVALIRSVTPYIKILLGR
ncbi:MAG: glycosyltransferase family 2 protein [Alistipes sp.]|nr:glycosyltransferase family 2 protein [Alistipes sp.]